MYLSHPRPPPPHSHPSEHFLYTVPPGFIQLSAIRSLSNKNVDVQGIKNGNQKWIFSECLSGSVLTYQIPTVEGERIRCVRQKCSINQNIELPVTTHEVRDGQHSRCLSSPLCLTRKRNVSQAKDHKGRLLDSHFKSVFLFLLLFLWLFI